MTILAAMQTIKAQDSAPLRVTGWAPLALGFRPFFALSALLALCAMAVWPLLWRGQLAAPAHYDPISWHAHEMLFGYAGAVIAGFLLTAVRNWSGAATWTGVRLAALALVWSLGRLLPWLGGVPVGWLIAVDAAFLPLVGLSLVPALWQDRNRVNRLFLPVLLLMGLVNLLSHLHMHGMLAGLGDMRRVMLDLVLGVIVLVGGRVLPFFTRSVLPGFQPVQRGSVERLAFFSVLPVALLDGVAQVPGVWHALAWWLFAASQAVRLAGWFDRRLFRLPVLWVLHVGYAWLVLGGALSGLAALGLFAAGSALHALTAGGVGVFTLGMMARVARGHTGRPIDVTAPVTLAFVAMNLAALLRVFGTAWFADHYVLWIDLAGALWVLAFGLFAWHYLPMLLRPRIDGRPG